MLFEFHLDGREAGVVHAKNIPKTTYTHTHCVWPAGPYAMDVSFLRWDDMFFQRPSVPPVSATADADRPERTVGRLDCASRDLSRYARDSIQ